MIVVHFMQQQSKNGVGVIMKPYNLVARRASIASLKIQAA